MTTATVLTAAPRKTRRITLHGLLVAALACLLFGIFVYVLALGWNYYLTPLADRPAHPLHHQMRPAGSIGIGFGVFSTALFAAIFVYPLRKKWNWLRNIGTTKHWLDFHIVMGLAAPFLVAIHSAFKFGGLAGMAYWIMMSVVASGIVGRYLYAQIPRSRKDAEISLVELQNLNLQLGEDLGSQQLIAEDVWRPLVNPLRRDEALKMPLGKALWLMLVLDLARPFRMAALRRQALSPGEQLRTLGGLLASSHPDLERVVALARRQSWLTAKICFLHRAGQLFKLWHVVHRPFSYSFLLLLAIHIGVATWMGFLGSL
jgi:hypothetical protein